MRNFGAGEDFILRNIDRKKKEERSTRGSEIEAAVKRLKAFHPEIKRKLMSEAINMESFRDLYAGSIDADVNEVLRLQNIFNLQASTTVSPESTMTYGEVHQIADIAEYLTKIGINKFNWLPEWRAIGASPFDDYVNKLDLILEHIQDARSRHIGLGIDVTYSKNLRSKILESKKKIDSDTLTPIKYFDSPQSHFRGEIKSTPRVVVGLDIPMIEALNRSNNSPTGLAGHFANLIMAYQIELQLAEQRAYAESKHLSCAATIRDTHITYKQATEPLQHAIEKDFDRIRNDKLTQEIRKNVDEIFAH
jgi:hypothetical protein